VDEWSVLVDEVAEFMTQGLHITHVVLSLDVGGLERVVLSLVKEAVRAGNRVSVLCIERPGKMADRAVELGATVHCVDKPPGVKLATVGKVAAFLEQAKPDVVHTHQIGALFYAGPAARRVRRGKVPIVVHTEHGKHFEGRRRNRWLGWWAARSAQRVFCVSADIARSLELRGVAKGPKVMVLANGIETSLFEQPRDGAALRRSLAIPLAAPVIGTVGRLAEVKRQDVLLQGCAKIRGHVGGELPHVLLVGGGPLEGELKKLAGELGMEKRVHFTGNTPTPEKYMAIMDVFALTSRSEGMPLVVLEAWAAGLPVVASRVGGLPEMIEEGVTGVMFESLDDAALATRLEELLEDREAAAQMGAAGQQHVRKHFDVSVMAANYERHYRELLGQESDKAAAPAEKLEAACKA
jgi:glycosyltransferase involved in cell wall biosynthesis